MKPLNSFLIGAIGMLAGYMSALLPAHAASSEKLVNDHGEVRLVSAVNAAGDQRSLTLGLHFKMKPGWKIYWRSPGDAGFPPMPNWDGSTNVKSVDVDWPLPQRFSVLGLETIGYKKEVVLPLSVETERPGSAIKVRATVPYLTCDDICVPYEAKLALDLPAGPGANATEAALIARYAGKVPSKGPSGGTSLVLAEIDRSREKPALRFVARSSDGFDDPDLLIEGPDGYGFGRVKRAPSGDAGTAILTAAYHPPPAAAKKGASLAGETLRLTMIDRGRAFEQELRVSPGGAGTTRDNAALPERSEMRVLLGILGIAVLGGFILNLMPCVLPVLSLKLLSVVSHGGSEKGGVRRGFLATSAGIVVSFLVLASGAVILKATGQAAGWGILFQNPIFLSVLAAIVTLFAANLWGLFEINLPGALSDVAAGSGHGHSLSGHFLTGAFATLLATPCSAPFLGTAVGFALARGAFEIYAIFAALGVGLAIPYLLVAAFPGLATAMPRPGAWMLTLRRILGVALAATGVWLLSVLAAQAGMNAMYSAALGLAFALAGFFFLRRYGRAAGAFAALALIFAVAAPQFLAIEGKGVSTDGKIAWQKFDQEMIARHVGEGKTVFVDVTADWCVTCKVNKSLVLEREEIAKRLNGKGIVAMQADWTRPDPVITAYLARYSRYGIPFNIVYGPAAPQGLPLPELLTRSAVLDALGAAEDRNLATRPQ